MQRNPFFGYLRKHCKRCSSIIKDIKIALLGVSHWHLPLYLPGIPRQSVIAVYDKDRGVAGRIADKFNCLVYDDYRQMIRDSRPDFVFAFAPHYQMREIAEYLINENIPFTIEKPVGMNFAEVETLYNQAVQKSSFCAIPFVWRYSDTVNNLKSKYLTSDIIHMSFKFIAGPPSRYTDTSPWMLSKMTAGGGCMTNLGVHFIDIALYLTDSRKADTLSSIYQFGNDYDIEIYGSSMLKMETGASLLLETGYAYPMSAEAKRENRWTIVTKNGYYVLAENKLEIREYGKDISVVPLNTDSDIYYSIFADTILTDFALGRRPRASLKEMLTVRKILDDINYKAKTDICPA